MWAPRQTQYRMSYHVSTASALDTCTASALDSCIPCNANNASFAAHQQCCAIIQGCIPPSICSPGALGSGRLLLELVRRSSNLHDKCIFSACSLWDAPCRCTSSGQETHCKQAGAHPHAQHTADVHALRRSVVASDANNSKSAASRGPAGSPAGKGAASGMDVDAPCSKTHKKIAWKPCVGEPCRCQAATTEPVCRYMQ
jgi:hypothetical protein